VNRYSVISSLLVLIISATVWWQGTSGFKAFTSETARRIEVLENPRVLSGLSFENQNYQDINISDYKGKYVLVDFIFTSCPDICHALGYAFKSIKSELENLGLGEHVQIVNISFDIERDTPEQLSAYVQRYTEDSNVWHGLRLKDPNQLKQLLTDFGIVVIPNERDGFDHNAAIHILDQEGRLVGIYDYQAQEQIIAHIRQHIETPTL